MLIQPPKQDTAKKCYVFPIEDGPVLDCSSTAFIPFQTDTRLQGALRAFSEEFLNAAMRYFSKPLQISVFLQRIHHIWRRDTLEDSVGHILSDEPVLRASWIPAEVHFYPTRYEVFWSLVGVQEIPVILPGFLERGVSGTDIGRGLEEADILEADILEADILEAETMVDELPGLPAAPTPAALPPMAQIVEAVDGVTIPYKEELTDMEKAKREKARQRVRQARLRAALAKLRAEKLAAAYYVRYNTFEGVEGSDSELSSEEDIQYPPT